MNSERILKVLYGSQTGTAEEVGERLGREAKRRHFKVIVQSLDHYDWTQLPGEDLILFSVATTGQGVVPDSMKLFWNRLLRGRLKNDLLENVKFGVFGLGDSSYPRFNAVASKLHKRLIQLGAKPVIRVGKGNDQDPTGYEGELDIWLSELWDLLLSPDMYPLPSGTQILPDGILEPPSFIPIIASKEGEVKLKEKSEMEEIEKKNGDYSSLNPFFAPIKSNERLTSQDWEQEVRLISFNIEGSGMNYSPGDVVYILPLNSYEDSVSFLKHLGYDPNSIILDLLPNHSGKEKKRIEFPMKLVEYAQRYLDFMGTMRRHFFQVLSHFASDSTEKERLEYFASSEGQEDMRFYNWREKRTAFQVIQDFPSLKIPLEYLFDIIPPIQPRAFSISSSLKAHPQEIQVTMAVVKFRTMMGRTRKGVCSNYLANLSPKLGEKVAIWIAKGLMKLPSDNQTPIIMVGPGTGLAIFRSFLEERQSLKKEGISIGKSAFFFGCRNKEKDYLHSNEWELLQKEGVLTLFSVAFSRDKSEAEKANRAKTYVQHKIVECSKQVWELLAEGAFIYVSGSAGRMPIDVRDAFKTCIQTEKQCQEDEAEKFLSEMERTNRYQTETWS